VTKIIFVSCILYLVPKYLLLYKANWKPKLVVMEANLFSRWSNIKIALSIEINFYWPILFPPITKTVVGEKTDFILRMTIIGPKRSMGNSVLNNNCRCTYYVPIIKDLNYKETTLILMKLLIELNVFYYFWGSTIPFARVIFIWKTVIYFSPTTFFEIGVLKNCLSNGYVDCDVNMVRCVFLKCYTGNSPLGPIYKTL